MNKLQRDLAIWGAVFTIIIGSLWHFVYGWSGNNFIVGLIAPVSESVWEHMKLSFIPLIAFSFVDYYFLRGKIKNFCFVLIKQLGIAIAVVLIGFYIYTPIVGHSILAVDISLFMLGVILARWAGYKIWIGTFKKYEFKYLNQISAVLVALLFAFFIYATLNPPHVGLFEDPNDLSYGIFHK